MKKFKVYRKQNYGATAFYPADEESQLVWGMLRPKVTVDCGYDADGKLTHKALEFFGYELEEVLPPKK